MFVLFTVKKSVSQKCALHTDLVIGQFQCYLSPFARSIEYNELHEDSLPLFTFNLMM